MNTLAVLSGDSRQIFINQYFNDYNLHSYMKTNLDFHEKHMIVCCTPFSKDGTYINCDLYTSFPIETFINLLKPGQIVFGGSIPKWVIEAGTQNDISFVDVLEDENVVWNNAMLTAEGLLAKIILNTDISLSGSKVFILGFGKCGTNIASRLNALNCQVTVYDHTPQHLSQAASFGYDILEYDCFSEHLGDFDIIINTVPCEIFTDYLKLLQNPMESTQNLLINIIYPLLHALVFRERLLQNRLGN